MSFASIAPRVDHALAHGHWLLAACAWSKEQTKRAGVELKFACHHAERAASGVGEVVKPIVHSALVTAEKLEAQNPCSPHEVREALFALGDAINRLGRHLGISCTAATVFDSSEAAAKAASPLGGER